ncbi:MAG: hypothetical protein RMM29_01055 [Planctomycetota bacterium]|nr:hypothetical protein [Planctomycetota bacterium]MCX8040400.1 hypothetical protein [Planctomycetota bacterium]MDW8372224.1 hypothetical protein [Planctomycetota bacterium]
MRSLVALALVIAALAGGEASPSTLLPPPPPALDPALAELQGRLPAVPAIVEREGRLWWQGPDAAVAIVGVDERGQPLVETACGTVAVQRRLIESGRLEAIAVLQQLAARAQAAGVPSGLRFAEGPLTGLHLRHDTHVVLADAVLARDATPPPARSADLERLQATIEVLRRQLAGLDLDEAARRALDAVLGKLPSSEDSGEIDDASPEFCRRVVRSGWLRRHFPTLDGDDQVEAAVRQAERRLPIQRWASADGELAEVRDAFGRGGWILRTPSRSAWLVEHPTPLYFNAFPPLVTVVELAAGSDPQAPAARERLRAVHLWRQGDTDWLPVGSWTAEGGLQLPPAAWAAAVPRRQRTPFVSDWLPPHIVVSDLYGDILGLAVPGGWLAPPRDGSSAEGERFLAEAARLLPDAAYLDLIGQYLLRYVYDSPDPRSPELIGNKRDRGDIHQTALQTLATTAGGMFRGDCDDIAELYETIAERQGRTAHVIGVPGHAACAWAERRGAAWHVFVLQTGPALEFVDSELPVALGRAYRHFDDSDTFDPNGVGLLLRFTNENQRGAWRLSYRIFSDPEYARIMIDVQRDWHYSTYQRGIVKMQQLIAGSELERQETANYRELAGLYSFTGQYALAAEHHEKAIELTRDDPISVLLMRVELVGHYADAERPAPARELAVQLIEREIPALARQLGPAAIQVYAQLAGTLAGNRQRDLAVRALRPAIAQFDERLLEALGRRGGRVNRSDPVAGLIALGDWLEGPDFNPNLWENHSGMQQFRRLSNLLAYTAIACLEDWPDAGWVDDEQAQVAARFLQVWLDRIAFRDVEDRGSVLMRYADAGRSYAALLGRERLEALLAAAPALPRDAEPPRRRIGGVAQVMRDAPWIAASPSYWAKQLFEMFDRDREDFVRAAAVRVAERALAASAALRGTRHDSPRFVLQEHLVGVIHALLTQNEPALRQRLRAVAARKDKDWYDQTAQWLGDAARRLDREWYARVLAAWHEEVGYEPKYFWIAWRAALNKAPQHALLAAELAVRSFPANASFVEELAYMRQVLGRR